MSLQSNSLDSGRTHSRARRGTKTTLLQRFGVKASGHRTEHLPVFRDFSGRLYHLAIQVREDVKPSHGDRT
ncbi:hypothetical protein [Roseibium alexandrii]|uniref:Uncharacterized protein n=1 Tax=Roseibium alexandrii (strain DSM 17067 / NCIMB 14079 / DFL-11) TaxID=244592 RepID=A0A5E8GZ59_ROSAD|nr:hypothetical protein [Roseibium alexandrii]EEE44313.1 hypothetical protein SADFL11_1600 [Roseibium alexandrii DFL-11]